MIDAGKFIIRYLNIVKKAGVYRSMKIARCVGFFLYNIEIITETRKVSFIVTEMDMDVIRVMIRNCQHESNASFSYQEELGESLFIKTLVTYPNTHETMRQLMDSVGATVVAPSDFQSESHQEHNNQ